jgi:hypothetical protein
MLLHHACTNVASPEVRIRVIPITPIVRPIARMPLPSVTFIARSQKYKWTGYSK